jgi:hypothetical protein
MDALIKDVRANADDIMTKANATDTEVSNLLEFVAEWANRLAVVSGVRWEITDVKQRCNDLDVFARMGVLDAEDKALLIKFHETFDNMRRARGTGTK